MTKMNTHTFDCTCTDVIVCPHCGYRHKDSWEIADGDDYGETTCAKCEKPFQWSRFERVTYTTKTTTESD